MGKLPTGPGPVVDASGPPPVSRRNFLYAAKAGILGLELLCCEFRAIVAGITRLEGRTRESREAPCFILDLR